MSAFPMDKVAVCWNHRRLCRIYITNVKGGRKELEKKAALLLPLEAIPSVGPFGPPLCAAKYWGAFVQPEVEDPAVPHCKPRDQRDADTRGKGNISIDFKRLNQG